MTNRAYLNKREHIAISPSGNYYGSEQTLLTYLQNSQLCFCVFLPIKVDEKYLRQIKSIEFIRIGYFSSPTLLYMRVALRLLKNSFGQRATSVYVNEAGHVRYVKLLSQLFRGVNFIVHVRLLEDVRNRQWSVKARSNLKILATSKFIQQELKSLGVLTRVLSSPFRSELLPYRSKRLNCRKLIVVSRLSEAKGIGYYERLANYFEKRKCRVEIHHYGTSDTEATSRIIRLQSLEYVSWISHGFEEDKKKIFSDGIVLHLNPTEPLGVVLLECLNHSLPFLAFNEGGTGEIGRNLNVAAFLFSSRGNYWMEYIHRILIESSEFSWSVEVQAARKQLTEKYGPIRYAKELDEIVQNHS